MNSQAGFDGLWSLGRIENEEGIVLVRFRSAPPKSLRNIWSEQFVVEWRLNEERVPSDRDEDPGWRAFEKELVPALERGNQSCLALVVTSADYREWYFYCGDLFEMQGRFNREVARHRELPVELHIGHDPEWNVYRNFVAPFGPRRA